MQPLNISVPLGIGDIHWVATKLRALSAKFDGRPIRVHVNKSPDHASIGLLRILPQVHEAVQSATALYDVCVDMPGGLYHPRWSTLEGSAKWREFDYLLIANGHLERGLPLESYLPGLETEWEYELKLKEEDFQYARRIVGGVGRVLLYPSGTGANRGFHQNWWKVTHWVEVVQRLNAQGIEPVFVGNHSQADSDYSDMLFAALAREKVVRCLSVIGKTTIPQIMALIKQSAVWCGLNSGLGIMSGMMRTPTLMLWADKRFPIPGATPLIPTMQRSWLSRDQQRTYQTLSYGSPQLTPANVVSTIMQLLRR